MPVIDCRGLACPQPVVTTKKALEQLREGEMIIIVDNASSCNNVERFALSQGCSVKIKEAGEDYFIHIHKLLGEDRGKATQPDLKAKRLSSISTLNSSGAAMRH